MRWWLPLGLLALSGCATQIPEPARLPEPDSLQLSGVRQSLARDIFRRPITIDRPMDVILVERMFARPSQVEPPEPEAPALPEMQLFTGKTTSMGVALAAITRSLGYSLPGYDPDIDPGTPIMLPHVPAPLEELLGLIEEQASVQINVFPHAKTLLVLPGVLQ